MSNPNPKGNRYLVGFGGPQGPASLGSTDSESFAISRAKQIATALVPKGFGTVVDRYKGTAGQWKASADGTISRQGIKLPDGMTGVLTRADLGGGDLPPDEARRRILASMRQRHGGGASVMGKHGHNMRPWRHGIPLSWALAPRYVVSIHVPSNEDSPAGYLPVCSSRKSLPAIKLARQLAIGAKGSKLYAAVGDRRSMQCWTFTPDPKGGVVAQGPGIPSLPRPKAKAPGGKPLARTSARSGPKSPRKA